MWELPGALSDCSAVQVPPAPRNRDLLLSARAPNRMELPLLPGCHVWSGVPDRYLPADASAGLDLGEARAHCLPGIEGPAACAILKGNMSQGFVQS